MAKSTRYIELVYPFSIFFYDYSYAYFIVKSRCAIRWFMSTLKSVFPANKRIRMNSCSRIRALSLPKRECNYSVMPADNFRAFFPVIWASPTFLE